MNMATLDRFSKDSRNAKFLDRTIPLDGASHADVVEYAVDIPMRYTECFAKLADGRTVRLRDARQFVAWCGDRSKRSFLFQDGGLRVEVQTDAGRPVRIAQSGKGQRKFIARDGSQMLIRRWGRTLARNLKPRANDCETDGIFALPQPH